MQRMMALSDNLKKREWQVLFCSRPESFHVVPELMDEQVVRTKIDDNATSIIKKTDSPDCLIIDHYNRDETYERQWRPFTKKIVVIDDLANRPHECDLLIDQNVNHTVSDYKPLVPKGCQLAIGPKFTILREEFIQWRVKALARRQKVGLVHSVFVCLGGTDPNQLMVPLLKELECLAISAKIDIAIGSGAEHLSEIQAFLRQSSLDTTLYVDSKNIAELMSHADVGIGAGGTMLWERSILGLPSITIALADNQLAASKVIGDFGITTFLDVKDRNFKKKLSSAVKCLLTNTALRKQYIEKSVKLIDGKGSSRILDRIEALF